MNDMKVTDLPDHIRGTVSLMLERAGEYARRRQDAIQDHLGDPADPEKALRAIAWLTYSQADSAAATQVARRTLAACGRWPE